ncbi:MAG TPA: DNA polymerase I [Sphingobacteriaceae bacterium]|nr:DNA polymerase I [Sphingobacteriaceae bacterium]
MLVDGYSLIFRAFFALPPDLRSADGQPTQAVLGFMNMLVRLLSELEPTHLAVAFDAPGPTFRHEAYPEYKAHREKTPDELLSQFPLVRELLDALNVPVIEAEGYEADDVIATLAGLGRRHDAEVIVVTGDRDLLQVVDEGIRALVSRRGITDLHEYDLDRIRREFGVEPRQLADVKGLMGDQSDNIPGVPGVGEKTALKLIRQFGNVDGVLANLDAVGGKKLPAVLAEHAQAARTSRDLALIAADVPLPVTDLNPLVRRPPKEEETVAVLDRLGFRTLKARLGLDRPQDAVEAGRRLGEAAGTIHIKNPGDPLDDLHTAVAAARQASLVYRWHNPEPNPRREPLLVLAAALEPGGTWIVYSGAPAESGSPPALEGVGDGGAGAGPADASLLAVVDDLLDRAAAGRLKLVVHDLKPLLARRRRDDWAALDFPPGAVFDTAIAAYLLDPGRSTYRVGELARQYLEQTLPEPEDLLPTGRRKAGQPPAGFGSVDRQALAGVLAATAAALPDLAEAMAAHLQAQEMEPLFHDIETPLIFVLAAMEQRGVAIDPQVLKDLGQTISRRIEELAGQIYELAGGPFNINSTQQLGKVLFEDLDLPIIKRTKTGYSTDAEVLETLAGEHPIVDLVMEHRQLAKLQSTYVQGLLAEIDPQDGRIHTTFQQTVAATGRLASTNPNLQNIPIRDEPGKGLRRAFTAPPDHMLVTADYSQIELRILAHLSGDQVLVEAFAAGEDIHRRTAAEVFGVPLDQVTPDQRSAAKAVNFGIIYGISDFGLSRQLGISRAEAKEYIDVYFSRYPGVAEYMEKQIQRAREQGYVRTMFNRIRYLPDIHHRVPHRRQFAERTAINTPIQGTAADIIKLAMVRVARRLGAEGMAARLVLQIHDELMVEAPQGEVDAVARLLVEEMTGAVDLSVALVVDVNVGPDWYNISPYQVNAG